MAVNPAVVREARRACKFFGSVLNDGTDPRRSFAAATDGDVVFIIARGHRAELLRRTILRWGGYGPDFVPEKKR